MGVAGVTNISPERMPALPVGDVARDGPLDPSAGKGAGTEGLPPGQSGSMRYWIRPVRRATAS